MALTQVSRGLLSTSIVDNGNATAITIDSSENVGIGMSPTTNNISKSISLVNGGSIFGYGAGTYITGNSNYNGAWNTVATGPDSRILLDGNVVFSRSSSASAGSQGTVSESMRITSDGNVGINTSSPTDTLSVGTLGSGSNSIITIGASTTGTSSVYFGDGVSAGRFRGYFDYEHTNDALAIGTAGTERMRIDASGNVGIGSASASAYGKFLVNGTGNLINANASSGAATFQLYEAGAGRFGITTLNGSAGAKFTTSGTERMRIDSSGNLLVGTTNAAQDSSDGVKIKKDGTQGRVFVIGSSATSGEGYSMHANGSFRFYVQYSGQINSTSQSILGISDVSLKENIRDLDRGLEEILALQPRRFDWKNGDGNDIMGFVAQEVETVLPELVHDYKYDSEETKLGLKMGDMIPTLVKAIQEQQETITALTARITQLENS